MHIPENYLSPETCATMTAVMLPVWFVAVQKVKKEIPREKIQLLGVGAALAFLGMMFNLPLPGGTTGHAVGGTLLAIIFGPWGACCALSVALIIQSVFFGDGGILAIGANCFNMAFVLPFIGYSAYKLLMKFVKNEYLSAFVGGFIGINVAALLAGIEFGVQPMLFHDAMGQPLYCPYSLEIAIPAMMLGHLTLFGIAEGLFTAGVLTYLRKNAPEAFEENIETLTNKYIYAPLAILIALVPLGLVAEGTAWGEWDSKEIATLAEGGSVLGFTPAGMLNGFSMEVLFPDYTAEFMGLSEIPAYILSAIIGVAFSIVVFKLIATLVPAKVKY